jgi:arabinofuranosyltransferase
MLAEARTAYRGVSIKALRSYKSVWLVVLAVALLQAFYAGAFIARTSFVVEGKRYFCLFDDAMISMRYADNWASGHGLVWNPGQPVEGYTTLLWTMTMGVCHLFRLSPTLTCLLVQVLGIFILWLCLAGTACLARSCRLLPPFAICAVILVGWSYNLIFFTLFGMETGLQTLLVTFALAAAVESLRKRQGRLAPMLWFAPAVLVRMDVLPVILFVFLFLCISVRKRHLRLIAGLLLVLAVMLGHFLWRHHYYGEWLPNTYYLKLSGWPLTERLSTGIRQTAWMAAALGLPALLALAALSRPRRWQLLLLGSFALGLAYHVYVGGDAWPLNRFVLPVSVGLLILTAQGIRRLLRFFFDRKGPLLRKTALAVVTVVCVLAINAVHLDHFLLINRPQTTAGNRMNIRYVLAVEKIAEPEASVAVCWAGAFPYFSRRVCVDLLGKCDRYIARLPVRPEISRPGHNKYDLTYSLSSCHPDIIIHAADTGNAVFARDYRPVMVEIDGTKIVACVRRDSSKVRAGKTVGWLTFRECLQSTSRECGRSF